MRKEKIIPKESNLSKLLESKNKECTELKSIVSKLLNEKLMLMEENSELRESLVVANKKLNMYQKFSNITDEESDNVVKMF